jgi:hypothetical protein
VDDGPDARKRHDTKTDPNEDAHVCNATNDVANQGSEIFKVKDLSLIHILLFLMNH